MNKRKCGTCRFFQDTGLAGSGWCHHPERRVSTAAMIMVRRGELACRNGWAQDLWSERVDAATAADQPDLFPLRRVPAATPDELAAVAAPTEVRELPLPVRPLEDVVVGQATVMPDADDRSRVLAHDMREAIRQARERYRDRVRAEPPSAELSSARLETLDGRLSDTADEPAGESAEPDGTSLADGERGVAADAFAEASPTPMLTVSDRDDRRWSRAEVRVGDADQGDTRPSWTRQTVRSASGAAAPASRRPDGDPVFEVDRHGTSRAEAAEEPVLYRTGTTDPDALDVPGEWNDPVESNPGRDAWRNRAGRTLQRPSDADVAPPTSAADYEERREVGAWLVADEDDEDVDDAYADELDEEFDEPLSGERFLARAEFAAEFDEPIDMTIRIAPQVPRLCRTCRDFRPADNGERGWCTSNWAFSHRRMVNADDLTCDTSLGCWWLPHDEIWLSTIDISAHGQPTPLLDMRVLGRGNADRVEVGGTRRQP